MFDYRDSVHCAHCLVSSTHAVGNCFSWSESSSGTFLQGIKCHLGGMVLVWPLYKKKASLVNRCTDDCAPECFSNSTKELWISLTLAIDVLVTCLTKALHPLLLSLPGQPELGKTVGSFMLE